jgi:DNA-binding XRE family transcriptional regulator
MKKKWGRTAMRFATAKFDIRKELLDVTFENGESFLVPMEAVLAPSRVSPGANGPAGVLPKWSKMRISETGDVLEVPAGKILLEIPWDRIRSLGDPAFRALWVHEAVERCRRLGRRIRELRLESGLTRSALAEMIKVPIDKIAKLEAGKLEPTGDLLKHIAKALGKRLRDFAQEVA